MIPGHEVGFHTKKRKYKKESNGNLKMFPLKYIFTLQRIY